MTTVVFIRHGESTKNTEHINSASVEPNIYPITKKGEEGAKRAGIELARLNKPISGFFTSPTWRTIQTSKIISEYIKTEAMVNPLLTERNPGKYEGQAFGSEKEFKEFETDQIRRGYPDIESYASMQKRIFKFYDQLKEMRIEGLVIAITHHDPIRPITAYFLGYDELQMQDYGIPPSSITVINFEKKGPDAILIYGSQRLPDLLTTT